MILALITLTAAFFYILGESIGYNSGFRGGQQKAWYEILNRKLAKKAEELPPAS